MGLPWERTTMEKIGLDRNHCPNGYPPSLCEGHINVEGELIPPEVPSSEEVALLEPSIQVEQATAGLFRSEAQLLMWMEVNLELFESHYARAAAYNFVVQRLQMLMG